MNLVKIKLLLMQMTLIVFKIKRGLNIMADILKIAHSVIFTEEDISKTSRFLDDAVSHTPIAHEKGKATIPPSTVDLQLGVSVNLCTIVLKSGNPFSLKIGDTTSPIISNVRLFTYDASQTNIFVSNSDTEPVVIEYVTAKW